MGRGRVFQGRKLTDQGTQIDALDGLRGAAVLFVFLSHTSNQGFFLAPHANFSGVGKNGVFLFFVLSSFLLTLPFVVKGGEAARRAFLIRYFARRVMRVYPLYTLYLLAGVITTAVLFRLVGASRPFGIPITLTVPEFVRQLVLREGKGITWSIVAEFRYYFVLPLMALTFTIVLKRRLIPSVLLTAGLIGVSQFVWPPSASWENDPRLGPYLPIFLIGSLMALVHHAWGESPLRASRRAALTLEALGIGALIVVAGLSPAVASSLLGRPVPFDAFHHQFVTFGLLWSIVVFASVNGRGLLRWAFERPVLRYFGFVSFSMYLLHLSVVRAVAGFGVRTTGATWLMLAGTIVLSHLSYIAIERPTSKLQLVPGRGAPR